MRKLEMSRVLYVLCILAVMLRLASCGGGADSAEAGGTEGSPGERVDAGNVGADPHDGSYVGDGEEKIPATDSAAAATAMATGSKTASGRVSWSVLEEDGRLLNLGDMLRQERWSVGVISTVPFCHATPACFVAHSPDRNHYYEGYEGREGPGISEEMLSYPVATLIVGAGNPQWDNPDWRDNCGYIARGVYERLRRGMMPVAFVEREAGEDGGDALAQVLPGLDPDRGARVFGLFGGPDGCFEPPVPTGDGTGEVNPATEENPTLAEASVSALDFLSRDREGFLLVVEQGDVDWANHHNHYEWLIGAMWDLETATRAVMTYVDTSSVIGWDDTMVILTSDHSNGYMRLTDDRSPGRGELPERTGEDPEYDYPGGEVTYGCTEHTNELVCLHGRFPERLTPLLDSLEGLPPAPGHGLLDNTHVFHLVSGAAGLEEPVTHIVLIIGDGMNLAHEVAASRYLYGTDDGMAWHDPELFPYSNWCTTWDVDTYDRYAEAAGEPPYSPGSCDPALGYDPELGGIEPLKDDGEYFLRTL